MAQNGCNYKNPTKSQFAYDITSFRLVNSCAGFVGENFPQLLFQAIQDWHLHSSSKSSFSIIPTFRLFPTPHRPFSFSDPSNLGNLSGVIRKTLFWIRIHTLKLMYVFIWSIWHKEILRNINLRPDSKLS